MIDQPERPANGAVPPADGPRLRVVSRLFSVVGFLALVAAWRLDQAVGTAYRTDWVAPPFVARQQNTLFGCSGCWRLPSEAWLWAYSLTGAAAFVFLLIAVLLFIIGHSRDGKRGIDTLVVVGAVAVAGVAVAAAILRQLGARGHGKELIAAASGLDGMALAALAIILVAAAMSLRSTEEGPYTLVGRVARFVYRQRVSVVTLGLLAVALMVLAQTSGQAVDSIRTWGFGSAHSLARLGFGICGTLLLSLVVYESGVQLTQVTWGRRTLRDFHRLWWFVGGGLLIAAGVVLIATGPFGYGPIVLGVLAVLVGVLDLAKFAVPGEEPGGTTEHDERVVEILAIVPLLLFAATGVAAAIDAELSRGGWRTLEPLVPSSVLAVAAILMTAEKRPRRFQLRRRDILPVVLVVGAGSAALVVFGSDITAAVIALVACAALFGFIWWLFHIQPGGKATDEKYNMLAVPTAGAVGLGSLLAVHIDTFGSTSTLGTLTLVVFGVAFWLAVLNTLVVGSFYLKPPSALFHLGIRQLPVLAIIVIAWVAVGAIKSPPTLHEARLVNREPIATANGETTIPATPTLAEVFTRWVDAQPELNGRADGSSISPVPMYLVAAHGGGVRASYWTALALDCIVGVSSGGLDATALQAGADATCRSQRRTRAQQADAARRIFVASGVSGGAMGLLAYARELISEGDLGDGAWVDQRLGRDFAAPTVGWALFHDATNHWFGLNSHRGGDCGWTIGSLCMTADRAAILEQAFDRAWPGGPFDPLLRLTWDMRSSADAAKRTVASLIPLLITNTTVAGGKARGVVTAANLGAWPNLDAVEPGRGDYDARPLAGTVEVVEAACATKDLRLSTAALLGSRFPYVSPSGHVSGHCRLSRGDPIGPEQGSACASVKASLCEMRLVDGGYADNSGLFTIDALWPTIRQLVTTFNAASKRKIAPVIIELDNHYRAPLEAELSASGVTGESVVPLLTVFGAHASMETYARARAYRLRPPGCTVTISPGLHPGLTAPLGWELSAGAREDLREGLVRPHPTEFGEARDQAVLDLRRLQNWLGAGNETASTGLMPNLSSCIPTETSPKVP